MHVILIAAITADGYIARHSNETVSWSLDLHLFKKQTMGFPVIMGSNTKKTLNIDLSGRQEIVVHRQDDPNEILKGLKRLEYRGYDSSGLSTFEENSIAVSYTHLTLPTKA